MKSGSANDVSSSTFTHTKGQQALRISR